MLSWGGDCGNVNDVLRQCLSSQEYEVHVLVISSIHAGITSQI